MEFFSLFVIIQTANRILWSVRFLNYRKHANKRKFKIPYTLPFLIERNSYYLLAWPKYRLARRLENHHIQLHWEYFSRGLLTPCIPYLGLYVWRRWSPQIVYLASKRSCVHTTINKHSLPGYIGNLNNRDIVGYLSSILNLLYKIYNLRQAN